MSHGGGSEEIAVLRRLIARLEGGESGEERPSGRADQTSTPARLPVGNDRTFWLDALLGGGLKRGALYEAAPGRAGDQAAACAFALGLAIRFARQKPSGQVIWIAEDFSLCETGAPYGPGLAEWGLDPSRLVLVRAADARTTLWALEEALKCRACAAVVGELWGAARRYGPAPARRLALAARQGEAPCILLCPAEIGGAIQSHGAQARFAVFAAPDPQAGRRAGAPLPVPERPRFAVQTLKTRIEGGRAALPDPEVRRLLVWNAAAGLFEAPADERADAAQSLFGTKLTARA